jgi:hypothetical protein
MRRKQTAPQRKDVQNIDYDDDIGLLDAEQSPTHGHQQSAQQAQHAQQLRDWQSALAQEQQHPQFQKRLEMVIPNASAPQQQQQKHASVGVIAEFVVATKAGGSPPADAAPATVQVQAYSQHYLDDGKLLLLSWLCPSEGLSGPKHEVYVPCIGRLCSIGF